MRIDDLISWIDKEQREIADFCVKTPAIGPGMTQIYMKHVGTYAGLDKVKQYILHSIADKDAKERDL